MDVIERFDPRIGRRVGPYAIEAVLGRGGMGVVYSARAADDRVVALKLMAQELIEAEEYRLRFLQEASIGPRLEHPHIVPVYEAGEADGELYIAMQLVEGRHLKKVLKEDGPLDPKRAVRLFQQAASALDVAHEARVVHRDVKPQNILISEGGSREHVFLTDFGLVKPMTSESTSSRTAQLFGTVPYLAPELIEALPADGRADLYSLGCVAFEALTGRVPFERENEAAALWAHVHESPPAMTDIRKDLPAGLNDVVFKALAKHPDDRFLTCGEFATELEAGLQRHMSRVKYAVKPIVARVPRKKTQRDVWSPNFFPELSKIRSASRNVGWWKVTGFALACSLVVSIQFGREGGVPQVLRDMSSGVGSVGSSVIETVVGDGSPRKEPEPEGDGESFVFPRAAGLARDGGRVAQGDGSEAAADPGGSGRGGPAYEIIGITRIFTFVSTRDGSHDIYSADRNGSNVRQLTTGPAKDFGPTFSPDGARIAFARSQQESGPLGSCFQEEVQQEPCPEDAHIWVMDADGSDPVQITSGTDLWDASPEWTPDGKSIIFTRWEGDLNSDLYITTQDSDGTWEQRRVTAAPGNETEPASSPSGTELAYHGELDDDNLWENEDRRRWDLFIVSAGTTRRLTRGMGAGSPTWSPDGRWLAFAGRRGIWRVASDGSNLVRLTRSKPWEDWAPDWSPDGRWIAFSRCDQVERCRILRIRARTGDGEVVIADDRGDNDLWPDWGPAV